MILKYLLLCSTKELYQLGKKQIGSLTQKRMHSIWVEKFFYLAISRIVTLPQEKRVVLLFTGITSPEGAAFCFKLINSNETKVYKWPLLIPDFVRLSEKAQNIWTFAKTACQKLFQITSYIHFYEWWRRFCTLYIKHSLSSE